MNTQGSRKREHQQLGVAFILNWFGALIRADIREQSLKSIICILQDI